MTTPFIFRQWGNPPELPADAEGMLDLTVRDLIALMQANNATHYTYVDDPSEFTIAVCIGQNFGRLASAAQGMYEGRRPLPHYHCPYGHFECDDFPACKDKERVTNP